MPAIIDNSKTALRVIHERLIDSWQKQSYTKLVPMIYPDFHPNSLLFIGINPSLDERAIVKVLKETEFENLVPDRAAVGPYFTFQPDRITNQLSAWQAIQQYHRNKLNYFKRHRELAAAVAMHWEQLDLFQLRESAQLNLIKLLQDNRTDTFFTEQLDIFFDLLEAMSPKVIVVLNGATSAILKKRWLEKGLDGTVLTPTNQLDMFMLSFRKATIPIIFSVHTQYKKPEERTKINQQIIDKICML